MCPHRAGVTLFMMLLGLPPMQMAKAGDWWSVSESLCEEDGRRVG